MKKRMAAFSMAALMALSMSFQAHAVWINEGPSKEEAMWRHTDSNGEFEKNVLRVSNGKWYWIGSDSYLDTGHEGKEINIHVNGVKYILTLTDTGMALDECRDESGNTYSLHELLGTGVSSYASSSTKANSWWQEKKSDGTRAWKYNDENKEPVGQGVYEIDGQFYYFDEAGEMKTNEAGGFVDGYYREFMDYALAVDRWIPYKGKWCYCGEDGRAVTGIQTIDGVTYDFGEEGYLGEEEISFPIVTSVELGEYPKEAFVGDVVEIPFTIMVKQKVRTASGSNAEYETTEADYNMFKSVYAVGDKNRFNLRSGGSGDEVDVMALNDGMMRFQYEIDWDEQVIRVPMMNVGLAYGTMRISHHYDANGKRTSVADENGFKIHVNYQDLSGEEIIDVFDRMEKGELNNIEAVDTIKCMDNQVLASTMMEDTDVLSKMKALDYVYSEEQKISIYVEVPEEVKKQLDTSVVKVVGLGFSGEKNKKIGLHVDASSEKMPEKLKEKKTAAFDLKVMLAGKEKNSLEIPIIITMPKPVAITSTDFELYHLHDGEAEAVSYIYDDESNTVTFAADNFSTYVFTEDKKPEQNGNGSSSESSDSDSSNYNSSSSVSSKKTAGTWKCDDKGWWFKNSDGSYPVSIWQFLSYQQKPAWYHFDAEGYMQTGWFHDVDGRWYYLNPAADGTCGSMVTGWKQIGGHWYYFNEQSNDYLGVLIMNGITPDGYAVDEQGRWIQ